MKTFKVRERKTAGLHRGKVVEYETKANNLFEATCNVSSDYSNLRREEWGVSSPSVVNKTVIHKDTFNENHVNNGEASIDVGDYNLYIKEI